MKKQSSIINSAFSLFVLQIAAVVLAFVRSAVFARIFGISLESDAFAAALEIPTVLFAMVNTAIKNVIIPLYSNTLHSKGKEPADAFFSDAFLLCGAVSIVLTLIMCIFPKTVIFVFCPGLSTQTNLLASRLLRIICPSIALLALIEIETGILNAYKIFVLPRLYSECALIVRIIFLLSLANVWGIYAGAIGYLVGTVVSFVLITIQTALHVTFIFRVTQRDPNMPLAIRRIGSVLMSTGAGEINRLIDKMIASFLTAGSISALSYALQLSNAISSLFITCIITVLYPVFSELAAKKDMESLMGYYVRSLSIFIHITLPLFCGAVVLSTDIISIIFARGAFDENAVAITSKLFVLYFASIVFSGLRQATVRFFYSVGDTKTPMKNTLKGICINIVLNIVLSRILGAPGLALATAVSTAIITVMLILAIKKKYNDIDFKFFWVSLIKVFLGSLVMLLVLLAVSQLNISYRLVKLGISILCGMLSYAVALWLLKSEDFINIVQKIVHFRRSSS